MTSTNRFRVATIIVALSTIASLVMVALAHAATVADLEPGTIVIPARVLGALAVLGIPVQYLISNAKWQLRGIGVGIAVAAFIYWVANPVDPEVWREYLLDAIAGVGTYAGILIGAGSTVGLGATWAVKKGLLKADSNFVPVDANPTQPNPSKEAS